MGRLSCLALGLSLVVFGCAKRGGGGDDDDDDSAECPGDPSCDEVCDNVADDDGDGQADCNDSECTSDVACMPVEDCDNDADDDGDGDADCADADCADAPACGTPSDEDCDNEVDDDGDGDVDCDDSDCAGQPGCNAGRELLCENGDDDDGDGRTDCNDTDCYEDPACGAQTEANCGNRVDDDDDGDVDCDDTDCARDPDCEVVDFEANCANGLDDDGDFWVDCDDDDCFFDPDCEVGFEQDCDNGLDDDNDFWADCDDDDCWFDPACDGGGIEDCSNLSDGDLFFLTLCPHPSSQRAPCFTPPIEVHCDNRVDDDLDLDVDCADADCLAACDVAGENCGVLGDEEGDGVSDCADPECALAAGCPRGAGAPCTADGDCASNDCLLEDPDGWAGGFCSETCAAHSDCAAGTMCVLLTADAIDGTCLPGCQPGTCREGYDCFGFTDFPDDFGTCLPACRSDLECPVGGVCNDWSGYCEPIGNGAGVGEACATNADCESELCLTEGTDGWTDGYCYSSCNLLDGALCPNNAACVDLSDGGGVEVGYCLTDCIDDFDCRAGYICDDGFGIGQNLCIPF